MRRSFPMRNTFDFESNGVRVTSDFESGNLWQCLEFAPENSNFIPYSGFGDDTTEGNNGYDETNDVYEGVTDASRTTAANSMPEDRQNGARSKANQQTMAQN